MKSKKQNGLGIKMRIELVKEKNCDGSDALLAPTHPLKNVNRESSHT